MRRAALPVRQRRFDEFITIMAARFQDYYETLGVPRTASADEIRRAYRKLSRQHHPDLNPGDQQAEARFKAVQEAYDVLSDEQKRRRYDQLGEHWKAGAEFQPPPGWETAESWHSQDAGSEDWQEAFGGEQFSDFFQMLFGRRARPFRTGTAFRMQGRDLHTELALTLEEAHRGGTRVVSVQSWERCRGCQGSGVDQKRACPRCAGRGLEPATNTLQVTIPAGVRDGNVLRLSGQGEPGDRGGPAGDLFVQIRLLPHPRFSLEGTDDLLTELPVAPWEAVLGGKVSLPTLDGRVDLTIPPGSQTGRRLRLRGEGLVRRDGSRGDLYVRLKVVVPTSVTPAERELFQRLAATSDFHPR